MPVNEPNLEDEKFSLKGVFQKGKEYVETQFNIIKLTVIKKSSRMIASLLVDAVKLVFTLLVVFFFAMSLGFYLSEVLDSHALGFLATGVIFILLIVLLTVFGRQIKDLIINLSISRIMADSSDDDGGVEKTAEEAEKIVDETIKEQKIRQQEIAEQEALEQEIHEQQIREQQRKVLEEQEKIREQQRGDHQSGKF